MELCSINLLQKSVVFGRWDGYRWSCSRSSLKKEKPWFQVKKYYCRFLMGDLACQVTVLERDKYWIVKSARKGRAFGIENNEGDAIAEVNQKQSSSGIPFGEDVLTLNVEPHIDHSLIVALLTVYGLIKHQL